MRHPFAWCAWTLAAAVSALVVRHPLYLTIILLASWLVYLAVEPNALAGRSWRGLLRLGALIWVITIPFNALVIHQGRVVLFRLPAHWPLVGGNITLEAVALGFVSGYSLWTLLVIFAAFNLAVDASQLLRYTPGFLQQSGVVTSIALTFVPQMLASGRDIREAQRIRGHRFRGWRDQLPLIMPLLTTALERAIQLAESLESRGLGGASARTTGGAQRWQALILLGLLLLLGGMLARAFWPQRAAAGYALLLAAAGLLTYAMARLGRQARRSRYRRAVWGREETVITAVGALVLAGVAALRLVAGVVLIYYPFPPYSLLPSFDPWVGLLLALLSLPGLMRLLGEGDGPAQPLSGVSEVS
jgi:energy-coupling factor transport system permease protein